MNLKQRVARWQHDPHPDREEALATTIRRPEVVEGEIPVTLANEAALRRALEAPGIEFIDENGGGPGLRLRKHPRAKPAK